MSYSAFGSFLPPEYGAIHCDTVRHRQQTVAGVAEDGLWLYNHIAGAGRVVQWNILH